MVISARDRRRTAPGVERRARAGLVPARTVVWNYQQVAVAQDAVKAYGAHLAQTRALHDQGLRTGIDVATAESAEAATFELQADDERAADAPAGALIDAARSRRPESSGSAWRSAG